jgi:hypothetical protein
MLMMNKKTNNKMKLYKIILSVVVACFIITATTSCSSDFLEEELSTTYNTDRFTTQDGLDELVTGAYTKIKFKFNYIWAIECFNLGVDEFTDANNSIPSFNCYSSDLNSSEANANQPVWDNMYAGVEYANILIQNIPLYYDETSSTYNTRLGEAYFFRGFFYLQLVTQFGGVPLKLSPSTGVETYFTRDSEEDCFAQIISDLETAYSLLPTSPESTGRLTKYAAAHFVAKARLTRASELYDDWNSSYVSDDLSNVITYASEVVSAHPLSDDYVDLWDYQYANGPNESESEVVLAAQFSDDSDTWGRYGNQLHLYYPSVYRDLGGCVRDISGDREFSYARSTNYTLNVYDRVNDSRFWKSFITCYGCNSTSGAPTWTSDNAPDASMVGESRFSGGELAIKYIINEAGDTRYTEVTDDATGVYKDGTMQNTHTFVRYFDGEDEAWVGEHGNYGYYGIQKRSVALSKWRDGYRTAISSQFGTRDGILARSAEDVLMIAEAYIRQEDYTSSLEWFNMLRDRAAYQDGEARDVHVDGGQAYENNSYCDGKGGGYSSEGAIYWPYNTYYESNDDMEETTASTSSEMHLNSLDDILNSDVDSPIYDELGYTSDADKMMCFLLNERTRELCGELYRWETLARTKRLEARFKAFNDGWERYGTFDPDVHYYRPIPQTFLDALTDESGNALTDEEKEDMQNPGY